MSEWEPKIVAFLCNWSSYAGADFAGLKRLKYPANIRVVKVPCAGRINPKFILSALRLELTECGFPVATPGMPLCRRQLLCAAQVCPSEELSGTHGD